MSEEKKYSLISVDVGTDEEVLHVDASGVHVQSAPHPGADVPSDGPCPGSGPVESQRESAPSADAATVVSREQAGHSAAAAQGARHSQDSYHATEEDLEGPVPMAGVQKLIIAVVILCLVGFAVYFGFAH